MWRPTIWKETLHKISQELIVALYFSKKNCITIDSQVRSIFRWDSNSGINEWLIVSDFVDSYRIYRDCELVLSVDYTHVSLVLVLQLNPCFWNDNFSCFFSCFHNISFYGFFSIFETPAEHRPLDFLGCTWTAPCTWSWSWSPSSLIKFSSSAPAADDGRGPCWAKMTPDLTTLTCQLSIHYSARIFLASSFLAHHWHT